MKKNLIALFVLIAFPAFAQDISVRASAPESAMLNEPFYYTVELKGSGNFGEVQLGKSSAFDLVQGGVSQSTSFSIINGQVSQSKSLSYALVPKKEGKLMIPQATVKVGDKTYTTNTVEILVVNDATQSKTGGMKQLAKTEIFMKPIVSKTKLYVGEATTVTYKLYYRLDISTYETEKDIKPEGFWVENFDLGKNLPTTTEFLNGSLYRVATIKKLQLFPTRAGQLEVSPYLATCDVLVSQIKRNRGLSLLEDMDSFLGSMGKKEKVPVYSPAIKFDVMPLPEPKPESFAGAVGKYKFTATLDKQRVKTGQPLTFKFDISGEGNIKTLPDVNVTLPSEFEKYEPKVQETVNRNAGVVSGSKKTELVAIPRTGGKFTLDTVKFSFFDPDQKKYVTLTSPRFEVEVEQDAAALAAANLPDKQEVAKFGGDVRFIKTNAATLQKESTPIYKSIWFYSSFLVPLAALLFVVFQQKRDVRLQSDVAFARLYNASPEAKKRLKAASAFLQENKQKEFFAELENALVKFIGNKFNTDDHALMKDEIKSLLDSKAVPKDVVEKCMRVLQKSEYYRYSPAVETSDDLNAIYSDAEQVISELSKWRGGAA
jgi:hypothetical protein